MKKFFLTVLVGVFVLCSIFGQSGSSKDLILVLDTSASMSDYSEDVSDYLIGPFLQNYLKLGDTFHLISFDDEPKLELSRRIRETGDAETIIARLLLMQPFVRVTDIPAAVDFAENYTANIPGGRAKQVIFITDGKNNVFSETSDDISAMLGSELSSRFSNIGADVAYLNVPRDLPVRAQVQVPVEPLPQKSLPPSPNQSYRSRGSLVQTSVPLSSQPSNQETAGQSNQNDDTGVVSQTPFIPNDSAETAPDDSSNNVIDNSNEARIYDEPVNPPSDTDVYDDPINSPAEMLDDPIVPSSPNNQVTNNNFVNNEAENNGVEEAALPPPESNRPAENPSSPQTIPPDEGNNADEAVIIPPSSSAQDNTSPSSSLGNVAITDSGSVPEPQNANEPVVQEPIQEASRNTVSSSSSSSASGGNIPWWLILLIILLLALIIWLIIFLATRNLQSSPSKAAYAASRRSASTAKDNFDSGLPMLSLFVKDQNTNIGRRNIHTAKPGTTFSVGGGSSDFLIFLVSVPPNIAEVRYDGNNCTFIPKKPNHFPDIGSQSVPNCIGKTIRVVSEKHYELFIRIDRFEDPLLELNRLMNSVKLADE
jgi:hypothetical protein